jgi:hypothetical protein
VSAPQFQLYEWITPALNEPTQFHTQSLFVLQPADVAYMIETYYSYDEGVMRDLLGKSLTKAAIRDIQDQAEILGTKVNSTRRQFDNLKRILTRIEQHMLEKKSAGNKSAPASRSILSVIMQVQRFFFLSVKTHFLILGFMPEAATIFFFFPQRHRCDEFVAP